MNRRDAIKAIFGTVVGGVATLLLPKVIEATSVHERWQKPGIDEDGWWPIRPNWDGHDLTAAGYMTSSKTFYIDVPPGQGGAHSSHDYMERMKQQFNKKKI